jgi:hypothetical protein
MKDRMTPEKAEILALEALAWLAGQSDGMDRFLGASGLEPADLRRVAGDRDLLGALLDFLLMNEPLLLDFCEAASITPQAIHTARYRLETPCD